MWAWVLVFLWSWARSLLHVRQGHARRRLACTGAQAGLAKPPWVAREVLALNDALNGELGFGQARRAGCRRIAAHFNAMHEQSGVRVGKSFVADVLARQRLAALHARQAVKHEIPATLPRNQVWAMDATALPVAGRPHALALGIVDHGTRVLLQRVDGARRAVHRHRPVRQAGSVEN